ncbi:ABC transporter permease [Phreatobacter sp. AB_2022a]|uniref:ABC transporter permease n=1 Tax=Phreatobacter sp. AB_2022a TaxID=3003134 RepID=UPI000570C423|nr:ABC transporter permease [Phreatobacter sp. AB_2022a]MCZ0732910.1 ABC transporter permease [Phreatobacter sp. AB_2022a]CEJ10479.1 Glutathione transport system permease protein GsiC [bacterium YEK0313]
MGGHILKRIVLSVPVLFGVLLLGFLLLQLVPGDVAQVIGGPQATPEVLEQIRQEMGLNRPLIVQFGLYIGRVLQGDLGYSMINNTPVISELADAIGPTAELMVACLIWSVPIGIALGTVAAVNRGRWIDRLIIAISVAGVSTPVFFIGLMLIMWLGYHWELFPFLGREGPIWTLQGLSHIALPALTLGLTFIGPVARMTRTAALEVLNADYVRTARAKGLTERVVVIHHVLRNALIPVVTLIGLQAGFLLGGAVVTETIFSWPGVGRLAVGAILSRDLPMAQGSILVLAISFIVINLAVDLLYGVLDPRVGKR